MQALSPLKEDSMTHLIRSVVSVVAFAGLTALVPAAALAELAAAVGTRRAAELGSRLTGLPRNRLYQALTKP
jgi:hypothetical protein